MVSHHLAMFGSHWSVAIGDIMYLIFHVTSQNHVIQRSSSFMISLLHFTAFPILVAIDILVGEQ